MQQKGKSNEYRMHLTKILFLIAVCIFCINGRVIKRQKKITRVVSKPAPSCGCPISVDLASPKPLLESTYGCLATVGCQNIFLDELPCGCNFGFEGYGVLNPEVLSYNHVPAIKLPNNLPAIDAGIPIPAIHLPGLYQCDVPSCQCRNNLDFSCSCQKPIYDFLNPIDVPSPVIKIPTEAIIQTLLDASRCGCQLPVEMCGCRQKCGCQLPLLDVPCNCQLPLNSCGCQMSSFDVPCSCQLSAFNLPYGCQLPGLDCGCQLQAFNGPCGCQLPVPNLPIAYQMPSLDLPCAYQLASLDTPCGCQLPGCGCQLPGCGCQLTGCGCQINGCGCQPSQPLVGGCGKYLRQVTLQPPFL